MRSGGVVVVEMPLAHHRAQGKLVLGSDNFFDLPSEVCLGYDSSGGHAFWPLFARPTIGASHSILPALNMTAGHARCNAADACPSLVGP
jgi:hypothetical protein